MGGIIRVAGLLLLTASCGGGGGGGSNPAPVANAPPNPDTGGDDDEIRFTRYSDPVLNARSFGGVSANFSDPERFSGGLAAADYDGDGDVDLYFVGGNTEPNTLFQDQGDGAYVEVAATVGLDLVHWGSGPTFGDFDNDGDLDLLVGAVEGDPISLFENRIAEGGIFVDVTEVSGIVVTAL